jgi:fructose-1-phosphate kinase PfkB-like protein
MTAPSSPPGHFYTLTGNLLAERTLEFPSWSPGCTQRATRETFQVGGKGINVTRMLTRLGAPNTALCFAGGPTGAECAAWLADRRLPHRIFATSVATRAGTVIRTTAAAPACQPETTFLGPDAPPDAAAIQACANFLDTQPARRVLAVCGSLPGWDRADFDPLRAALQRWAARGPLVADTYGPPLTWLATQPLAVVKINAHEFRTFVSPTDDQPPPSATQWVITDGPNPVRLWMGSRCQTLTPPRIVEVSPTGSGDVLLACILHARYVLEMPLDQAVAFALPYAAANAAHSAIAEFPDPATVRGPFSFGEHRCALADGREQPEVL